MSQVFIKLAILGMIILALAGCNAGGGTTNAVAPNTVAKTPPAVSSPGGVAKPPTLSKPPTVAAASPVASKPPTVVAASPAPTKPVRIAASLPPAAQFITSSGTWTGTGSGFPNRPVTSSPVNAGPPITKPVQNPPVGAPISPPSQGSNQPSVVPEPDAVVGLVVGAAVLGLLIVQRKRQTRQL